METANAASSSSSSAGPANVGEASSKPPAISTSVTRETSADAEAVSRASEQDAISPADQHQNPSPSSSEPERKGFIQRLREWSPVMVLENQGSVARDHLASERTWLAYIRTSLAISSAGVALVQLFTIAANRSSSGGGGGGSDNMAAIRIQQFARPLGAATVFIGLGVCLLGLYRYFAIQTALTLGKFPTARYEVHTVSLLLGVLIGIVFGVLVAFPR